MNPDHYWHVPLIFFDAMFKDRQSIDSSGMFGSVKNEAP
jgi:hypothetical protein